MKKILFILCLSLISQLSYSQQIKKYDGSYLSGTATYEYYEDQNGERVLNGDFSYSYEDWDNTYPYHKIIGSYRNGKKNGVWTTTVSSSNKEAFEVTIATYNSDVLNGSYTFEKYFIDKNKGNKKVYNVINKFEYKNGRIISFLLSDIYPFELTISGFLTIDGYADSLWEVNGNIEFQNEGDDWLGTSRDLLIKMKYEKNCLTHYSEYDKELGKYRTKFEMPLPSEQSDTTFFTQEFTAGKEYYSCYNKYETECHEPDEIRKAIAYRLPANYSVKKVTYRTSEIGQKIIYGIDQKYASLNNEYNNYFISEAEIKSLSKDKYIPQISAESLNNYNINIKKAYSSLELVKSYIKLYKSATNGDVEPVKALTEAASTNSGLAEFLKANDLFGMIFFNNYKTFVDKQFEIARASIDGIKNTSKEITDKRKEFERLKDVRSQINDLSNKYKINKPIPLSQNDVRINLNGYFVINDFLFKHLQNVDIEMDRISDSINLDIHPDVKLELSVKRNSYQDARKELLSKNITFTKEAFNFKVSPAVKNLTINWSSESLDFKDKRMKNVWNSFVLSTLNSINNSSDPKSSILKIDQILTVLNKCQQKLDQNDETFFKSLKKLSTEQEIFEFCTSN